MTRILSHTVSGRDENFRKRVRARDGKCVITGVANPQWRVDEDNWSIYHAAHIFPLSGEERFIANGFSRGLHIERTRKSLRSTHVRMDCRGPINYINYIFYVCV
ncbi:hypothetical protein V1509DRAFT_634674, partial [Lipomyces kononenkoae]